MANFVDFTPLRNSYRGEQSAEPHTHSRLSAAHTKTMSLFYQTITLLACSDLCEGGILVQPTAPRSLYLSMRAAWM